MKFLEQKALKDQHRKQGVPRVPQRSIQRGALPNKMLGGAVDNGGPVVSGIADETNDETETTGTVADGVDGVVEVETPKKATGKGAAKKSTKKHGRT